MTDRELAIRARGHIEKRHDELVGPFQRAFSDAELLEFMTAERHPSL